MRCTSESDGLHAGKPDSESSERVEKRNGSLLEFPNQVQTTFWQFLPHFGLCRMMRSTAFLIAHFSLSRTGTSRLPRGKQDSTSGCVTVHVKAQSGSFFSPATRQFGDNVHRNMCVTRSRSMESVIVVWALNRLQLQHGNPMKRAATRVCGRSDHRDSTASGQAPQVRRRLLDRITVSRLGV